MASNDITITAIYYSITFEHSNSCQSDNNIDSYQDLSINSCQLSVYLNKTIVALYITCHTQEFTIIFYPTGDKKRFEYTLIDTWTSINGTMLNIFTWYLNIRKYCDNNILKTTIPLPKIQ